MSTPTALPLSWAFSFRAAVGASAAFALAALGLAALTHERLGAADMHAVACRNGDD